MDRVAIVSPGLLPVPPVLGGSVETVIHQMALQVRDRYNVDIISPGHSLLPQYEAEGNIKYHRFPSRPYAQYFREARAFLARSQHSIIQVENRPLFIPRTKALKPECRFICSLHSLIHINKKLIGPSLTEKIFGQSDKVLVYSRFMQKRLAEMFPRVAGKFHFIHLATDADRFKPAKDPGMNKRVRVLRAKHRIPDNYKVVLFAGRLIPDKGVHILLPAMEQVFAQYPDCCLVIMGSGWYGSRRTSPYISELRRKSRSISNKIIFTNYVSNAEVPGYFAMADVFVCPSQWDEPFGLVNVEAMASGTPVVASAKGGIPEIVSHGADGFLVKKETDPASFAGPILKLLNNPRIAENFGNNGRKKVVDYFNWQRAGRQLIDLYESLT